MQFRCQISIALCRWEHINDLRYKLLIANELSLQSRIDRGIPNQFFIVLR